MNWIYSKQDGLSLRTCDICKTTQFKTAEGDWGSYFTFARVKQFCKSLMNCDIEKCVHSPEEESE